MNDLSEFINNQLSELSDEIEVETLSHLSRMYDLIVKHQLSVNAASLIVSNNSKIHPKLLRYLFADFMRKELYKVLDIK